MHFVFILFYIFISRIDSYLILEIPSEWSRDAKSALLYVSGEAVATIYLANKAINGRIAEVAYYFIKITVVARKMQVKIKNIHILPVLRDRSCHYSKGKKMNYKGENLCKYQLNIS